VKNSTTTCEKYKKFRAAWYVEGHRLHKYDDVHQCWKEAFAHSTEHPRTEIIIIEWIMRLKDYVRMAVFLDNQAQPKRRVSINQEGVFSNGRNDENRND